MSLEIKDTSTVPNPNGWEYYVEPTNYTVITRNYAQIYPMVVQHCLANGTHPPTEQQVIDQMCAKLHVPCHDGGNVMENPWSLNLPLPARVGGCCG